jgi:alpha-L-rhamnosidase
MRGILGSGMAAFLALSSSPNAGETTPRDTASHSWRAHWISAPDSYLDTLGEHPGSVLTLGRWIWPEEYSRAHLLSKFTPSGTIAKAVLEFQGDNEFDLYLNGQQVPVKRNGSFWGTGPQDVGKLVCPGENHIAVRGYLTNVPERFLSAVRGAIRLDYEDGHQDLLQTGEGWTNAARGDYWQNEEPDNWQTTPTRRKLTVTALHPRQVRRSCYFRRDFQLAANVSSAEVAVTARGLYELHINGRKVSDDVLTPDSSKDPVYQCYDVTEYLTEGKNVIAALTGNGWYNSESWGIVRVAKPELLVQLSVTLENGDTTSVLTDGNWRVIASPLLEDDLQFGERYDARQSVAGWDVPGTDTSGWHRADVSEPQASYPGICQSYEPIRIARRVRPLTKRRLPDGTWLFDFGENTAGRVCLRARNAKPGDMICIRMYERLDKEGSVKGDRAWGIYSDVFYPDDSAPDGKASMALKNMDVYVCRGDAEEIYQPRFTYTGFRFACIEGYPGEPSLDDVESMVIHTDLPQTGTFVAGNTLVSDISSAILRTYCNNIHGGPTDCPTREKNFWNGDIQAFAPTACWYLDNSRFLAHWTAHGSKQGGTAYGWGDEEYTVPWTLYRFYGDESTLKAKYLVIKGLVERRGTDLAHTNARWRDHVATHNVPEDFFAACCQCYMYKIVSRIAGVLGENEDSSRYLALFQKLRKEFNDKYLEETAADYSPHCQSGVVLPLAFDLVPDNMREGVAARLNRYVVESDFHLTTGFIATPHLLPLLCDFGYTDTALKVATQTTYPSWGAMLKTGATTITAGWRGEDCSMDGSADHYALGTIGRWFFEYLGGIRLDPEVSAFKRFLLKPVFYPEFSPVSVSYTTRYGEIKSAWRRVDAQNCFTWEFTIPEGTTAVVYHPGREPREYEAGTYSLEIPYEP